jgi:hypothetical protein
MPHLSKMNVHRLSLVFLTRDKPRGRRARPTLPIVDVPSPKSATISRRSRVWSSCQRTSRSRSAGRLGLETLAASSLSGKARRNTGISGREPGSTSGSRHGVGDLFTALRRQGLIAEELVLQLATFLRSLDLFFELIVLAPRTLTANQVRHGGKQGTDNPELSRIHSSTCPALTSLPRSFRPKD